MFFKQGKTNIKYLLILVILAVIVGGGILWWIMKQESSLTQLFEIKKPEEKLEKIKAPAEIELEENRVKDSVSNVEIIAREGLDKKKTDIYIKDLNTGKEEFFLTLSDIDRDYLSAEFRNGHLYILKGSFWEYQRQLWKYSSSEDKGIILYSAEHPKAKAPLSLVDEEVNYFAVSPNENFVFIIADRVPNDQYYYQEEYLEDEESPFFAETLIFINLLTKEQKEFVISKNLATSEMISERREGIERGYMAPSIRFLEGKWSSDSEKFLGVTYLEYPADPIVPATPSLFKINVKTWEIEKSSIPAKTIEFILPEAINAEREAVLFETESSNGDLLLKFYDLRPEKEKVIISYSKEIFNKYFKDFLHYCYPMFSGGERRDLEPKWINDDTISYLDFETREEVIQKIE